MRAMLSLCAGAAVLATAAAADGAVLSYHFFLDGLQEVPPNASPGFGDTFVTLDTTSGAVSVSGTYSGLLGAAMAAHIHGLAGPGVNAPVIVGLTAAGGSVTGSGVLTPGQVSGMVAGLAYVNIHTTVFPGGEIRGQVVPAPGAAGALLAASLVIRRRRR